MDSNMNDKKPDCFLAGKDEQQTNQLNNQAGD